MNGAVIYPIFEKPYSGLCSAFYRSFYLYGDRLDKVSKKHLKMYIAALGSALTLLMGFLYGSGIVEIVKSATIDLQKKFLSARNL